MEATLVVLIVLVLLVILFVARSVRMVPSHAVEIVERLGRYSRTLSPGLNLVLPGVDQTRARIDLREQRLRSPALAVDTTDNHRVTVPVTVLYQVVDPRKATYEIENYVAGLDQLLTTVVRNVIGGMTLDDVVTSHGHLTATIRAPLAEAAEGWGVQVREVELGTVERP